MNLNNPIVSISCITYNHAPYIRQCIDGFLMQKTNFAIEILIHDDASTDGTEEIIHEYEAKFPDIIKPIYEKENQWVKGRRGSAIFNFPRARGKYIAMCEGDDYWTDPFKLQKQVDFLEANTEYSMCFHNSWKMSRVGNNKYELFNKLNKNNFTINDVIEKPWFIPTQSIVFRNEMLIKSDALNNYLVGDYALQLILASKGPLYYFNEVMGTYRKHSGGVSALNKRHIHHAPILRIIETLYYFDCYSGFKYHKDIKNRITELNQTLFKRFLYDRPIIIRLLSADYYIFKIKKLLKNKCK